jgi:hypothetical protein
MGIEAGLAWHRVAEATVVYQDYDISPGMACGIQLAKERGIFIEYCSIGRTSPSASTASRPNNGRGVRA